MTAIWWVRRDLRLHDNPALHMATSHGDVIPVFVLDPAVLASRYHHAAARRRAFLFAGLRALDASLQAMGSRLIVRHGRPDRILSELVHTTGAEVIVAAADYSPYSQGRDEAVRRNVPLTLTGGIAIRQPQELTSGSGRPFRVFKPFEREWLRSPPHRGQLLPPPGGLIPVPRTVKGDPIPGDPAPPGFPASEMEAQRRLREFSVGPLATLLGYTSKRDRLDIAGTSALSPYLRFGMLSPRLAAIEAMEQAELSTFQADRASASAWVRELIWRDFYLTLLYHSPEVLTREFNTSFSKIQWRDEPGAIEAWQSGRTGYPVVDASMRQLAKTGWITNRSRMIVASFLVKQLLVDWRIGESFFMEQLIDGDLAANNGGWQWTAGVGTDAAPYFRVFNPVLQGQRYDPEGDFVRRWIPELTDVPTSYIHRPWLMPKALQDEIGVHIGRDYPRPLVELSEGRQRALGAYRQSRN